MDGAGYFYLVSLEDVKRRPRRRAHLPANPPKDAVLLKNKNIILFLSKELRLLGDWLGGAHVF